MFSCQNSSQKKTILPNMESDVKSVTNNQNPYKLSSTKNNSQPKQEDDNRRADNDPEPKSVVKYYTNSFGESVQSPTHYQSQPSEATAQCRDGTYSFSRHRRGTCSGHGGVSNWLK